MLKEILEALLSLSVHEIFYFDSPLKVKMNPHDHEEWWFWAARAGEDGKVYVMDAAEQEYEVEKHEESLVQSLYQRLQFIQYKKRA